MNNKLALLRSRKNERNLVMLFYFIIRPEKKNTEMKFSHEEIFWIALLTCFLGAMRPFLSS